LLLRENAELKVFIWSERELLIPLWTGNINISSDEFDIDDMSSMIDNWEDELN